MITIPSFTDVSSGHGTGTALGDPIEVGAIKAALGQRGSRGRGP